MVTRPRVADPAVHDGVEQHSVPATIAYHLLPGLLIVAVTVAAVPWFGPPDCRPSPPCPPPCSSSCPSCSVT